MTVKSKEWKQALKESKGKGTFICNSCKKVKPNQKLVHTDSIGYLYCCGRRPQ